MIDPSKTLSLAKGGLMNPEQTWAAYLPQAGDWQKNALLLAVPFVVVSYTVWFVLSQVFPWQIGGLVLRPGFGMYLRYMLFALVGAAAISFVFAFMAGVFKGRNSFAHALAATSLAFIPGYLGNALSPLPIAGVLLSLGGGIYSLVLLWRILPAYLELPDDGRVLHFISSLVLTLVLATALAMLIGVGRAGMQVSGVDGDQDLASAVKRALHDENESERGGASPFSGMERSARIMEDADDDTYQPPRDGRLGEAQVQQVIANLQRTRELREAEAKRLERLAEDMEKKKNPSLKDLGGVLSGVSGSLNLVAAEMEVVKTGGGNWAEHLWVKSALRTAWIQKTGSAAIEHNYSLYQAHEAQLEELLR